MTQTDEKIVSKEFTEKITKTINDIFDVFNKNEIQTLEESLTVFTLLYGWTEIISEIDSELLLQTRETFFQAVDHYKKLLYKRDNQNPNI